jgi:flavin-dependent dehydrogenase
MRHGFGHQLVGTTQFGGDQVLDAGNTVAHHRREDWVAEVDSSHHARRSFHSANILVTVESNSSEVDRRADVVVVGAGPSGSAAAAWAARAGRDVLVVDACQFPRDKACGDGLTPRAVLELQRLGLGDWLAGRIRHDGLKLDGFGSSVEVRWPGPSFPDGSSAVPRTELDDRVRQVAEESGASMLLGHKAIDVTRDSAGRVTTVILADGSRVACRWLIVADGARSPLGRVLGRQWHQG